MLFALLSVAVATTTHGSSEVESPVEKVVKLLTDMQKNLKDEAKAEEEQFEKLSCWCETNNKEKTQAITDNENAINELEAEIDQRTKRAERLAADIKSALADQETLKESISSTEKQREKTGKENQAQIIELTKNVEGLKGAIVVLSKHQMSAFPQLKLDFLSMSSHVHNPTGDELDNLSSWMQNHQFGTLSDAKQVDIEKAVATYVKSDSPKSAVSGYSAQELATLSLAKKLVTKFVQATPYNNQSGEIFGILRQLKEQLEGDLKETEEGEAKSKAESAEMLANLKDQLASAEEREKQKLAEQGENGKALADAKEELEDTKNSLDADSKFLKQLIDMCKNSDAQWEERTKTRTLEMAAVGEALGMLTTDANRDLFSSASSFLQTKIKETAVSARTRAADVLKSVGKKTGDAALVALSTNVQLDGFVKVKAAIDEMVVDLKQQQADEVKHKDFCNTELQTNEMETMDKTNQQKDLETKIDMLTSSIDELTKGIATAKAELAQGKVELQRANEDRASASKEFQKVVADQRAVQKILVKVQDRLNEFYALPQMKHTAVQLPPNAPVKFGEYKQNAGSSPVITMIGNLVIDAQNVEKEAITDENSAQAAYEGFVSESNAAMAATMIAITNKIEIKATAETELEQANANLKATMDDLEALAKYAADVHKACDFVMKNFDVRQQARSEEMEALAQAKSILSGMQ